MKACNGEVKLISKEDLMQRWNTTETHLRELAYNGILQSFNHRLDLIWPRFMILDQKKYSQFNNRTTFEILWPGVAFFDLPSVERFEQRHHIEPSDLTPKQSVRTPKKDLVIAEAKRLIQQNPYCQIQDAVRVLNQYLTGMGWEAGYSDKQIKRIISGLGFLPGKPGRPQRNN